MLSTQEVLATACLATSAGGGGALLAAGALAWSIYRVRHLGLLRHTFASIKETWQWAERRLKSGTT